MNEPKYYFARSKLVIVTDINKLGPAYCAEIGAVYHAFQWSEAREDYFLKSTATYKGQGVWTDETTGEDLSLDFKWAHYLVKKK